MVDGVFQTIGARSTPTAGRRHAMGERARKAPPTDCVSFCGGLDGSLMVMSVISALTNALHHTLAGWAAVIIPT